MPEDLLKQRIESQLVEAARSARDRYNAGECDASEYATAIKRLDDFLVEGKWPDDLKPIPRDARYPAFRSFPGAILEHLVRIQCPGERS